MSKKFFPTFMAVIILSSLALTAYADELPPTLGDISTTSSGTTATSVTSSDTSSTTSTDASASTSATTPASDSTVTATGDLTTTVVPTSASVSTGTTTDNSATATHAQAFQDFTDVPVSNPDYNAIIVLRYQGVISGYPDNTFHPDQPLNRVEALKLIFSAASVDMSQGVAPASFQDTAAGSWYSGYLNRAVFLEIVNGYADGTFKPERTVNLVEFLKMLEVAQKIDLSKATLNQIPYADVMPGEWYSKYVNFAKINNLLTPDADNKIHPDQPVTRAQAAEIIYRFRNAISQLKTTTDASSTASTSTNSNSSTMLGQNMALYVSPTYKFAIQYPRKWFYSAIDNAPGSNAIHTYGFGDKDLSTNAPLVTLELLPDDANFTANLVSDSFQYLKNTNSVTVMLSAKIDGSNRIYRLTGPATQEDIMLDMLKTLTANIDGLSSYNPAEKPADTTTTTSTTTTTDTTANPTT